MTNTRITIYGCSSDEAALFRELASHFDIRLTITETAISEANIDLVQGNRCISISHKTPITPSILQALAQVGVKYISTRSAGYNHIDISFAQSVGITVGNVAYSPDSVADYTLMLILMAIRDTQSTVRRVALRDFRLNEKPGKELRDMTIGIIGTGRIGMAVIKRLRAFGCRILTYDRRHEASADYVPLYVLLRQSDIITLHTPLTAETHHLLDHSHITQMKPGAFVINTGRGALIDTEALITALESGHLGGAAIDVIEGEEGIFYRDCSEKPVKNDLLLRLQKLPNALITPHTAYYTDHALSDMARNSIINCLEFEKEKNYE